MKSVLIIGMGRFGHHLAENFLAQEQDVMVMDIDEKRVEDITPYATSTRIGDCTNPEVLKTVGINNFDMVFVCIGTNFQNSLEVTSLVKELGAKHVVSRATRDIQAKFLLRNGADEVIYPEKDIAEKCAERYSLDNIFDYMELTDDYAIYEMKPLTEWVDKSIREYNIAAKYKVSILGIKQGEEKKMLPSPDYVIDEEDHLMIMAKKTDAEKILKHFK